MSSTGARQRDRRVGRGWPWPAWLVLSLVVPAVLQITTVNYWPRFPSPNERARAYQALAVATRGDLCIDPELSRYGAMEDVAVHDGRHYPNKAPGLLPLLVPAAAAARLVAGDEGEATLRMTLVAGRVVCSGLPFLGTILLLAALVVRRWPRGGPLVVAVYAVATPALSASLLLFSHAATALFLLAAAALLSVRRVSPLAAAGAGLLLGWTVCCEYQLAVPAALLVALALTRLSWRGTALLVAGAVVPLTLLALYDAACFGSPWSLSSAHEAAPRFAALAAHGLFGISPPTPAGLAYMLFSPARGLLVWVPLAAWAAGAARWPGRRSGSVAWIGPPLAALALVALMAGYPNRHGGWFPGPRYLLGVLPLLLWAAAEPLERMTAGRWGRPAAVLLALWGWISVWPITAAFPFPPSEEPFPSLTLAPRLLADGALFPSWLPEPVSIALWAAAGAAAVALLVAIVPASRQQRLLAVALVAALASGASLAPPARSWSGRLARAVLHDVYAGLEPGELEALRARSDTPSHRAAVDAWLSRREAGP